MIHQSSSRLNYGLYQYEEQHFVKSNNTKAPVKGAGPVLKRALLNILLFCLFFCIPAFARETAEPTDKWGSHMEMEGKLGNRRNLGKLNAFLPVAQGDDSMLFADLKVVGGKRDTADAWSTEGNFGIGFRRIVRGGNSRNDFIWGLYGYYDYLRTENDNFFSQGTFGAELFTHKWDFRVNGYLPETKTCLVARSTVSSLVISGTSLYTNTTTTEAGEKAIPGFDVEAGYTLDITNHHRIKLHAGYFRFDRSGAPEIEGPSGRLEYVMDNLFGSQRGSLTLSIQAQTDSVRDDRYFASVRVRVPFGKVKKSREQAAGNMIEHRMTESIVRDIDIVTFAQDVRAPAGSEKAPTVTHETRGAAVNTLTGNNVTRIIYASSTGTGTGTEADPAAFTNAGAVALAGNDGVIVLLDSTHIAGNNITLTNGQTLVGAGGTLELKTASGDRVTKTFAGSTPTIANNPGNTTTLVAGNGSTIAGLRLSNAGVGVNVNGKNNVALKNLTIDVNYPGATSRGVYVLGNSSDITITNVNVTAALGSNNTGMTFDTSDHIFMTGGAVKGVTSAAGSGYGVLINGAANVTFNGVAIDAISGTGDSLGIAVTGAQSSVTVQGCDITGITGGGANIKAGYYASAASGSSHNISNTHFHDIPTGDGIRFQANDHTISGTGNSSGNLNNVYQKMAGTLTGTIEFNDPVSTVQN